MLLNSFRVHEHESETTGAEALHGIIRRHPSSETIRTEEPLEVAQDVAPRDGRDFRRHRT